MNRPVCRMMLLTCLIASPITTVVCGQAFAVPQPLAIQDFANNTGDTSFDWLSFSMPEALAECLWQLPGVARGPATDCDPKPHDKFWVYRITEAEKALRAKPPPEWYRAALHDAIAYGLAAQDPLDLPANPEMLLTGSIRKAGDALEITVTLATASGETVKELHLNAPIERAIIAVPAEAARPLRSLLTSMPAARAARPSLGTESAEAAKAYLEARFWMMSQAVEVLKTEVVRRGVDKAKSGRPAAEDESEPGKSFETGREHAISSLTRAISLDERFARPHTLLGVLYIGMTHWQRDTAALAAALQEYETAVRLGDKSSDALTGVAACLFMQAGEKLSSGDIKEGQALLDRCIQGGLAALRVKPDSVWIRLSTANAYLPRSLEDPNQAHPKIVDREAFEAGLKLVREAVKLAPDCKEAKDLLRRMELLRAQYTTSG